MATTGDLIDFDVIEGQKENIQSLPGGRSARALANMFSQSPLQPLLTPTPSDTRNLNDAMRMEYEKELQSIAESDDPLDIYDRYVRWTFDAYPSAQATPASQVLPLLERATKSFLNSAQYKNDPRYLKLWISYIRFFSDTPRETFAFLARHGIGEGLALFYEEFAAWLEGAGRWTQAEEVYIMGIEKEARPAVRLQRKFDEFQQRFAQRPQDTNEPSSPALPTIRPALAAKLDPFAPAAPRDPQAPRPNSGVGGGTSKGGKPKLQIFSDGDDAAPAVAAGKDTKGWESIGSLADRRKENVMEPKPWVGETLKAGGKKSSTKMAVFKDESLSRMMSSTQVTNPVEHQVTVNPKGVTERIFVNLEAVYPNPNAIGTELSIEELRAGRRGWLNRVWEPELPTNSTHDNLKNLRPIETSEVNTDELVQQVVEKLVIARDPVPLDENGIVKEPAREGKGRRMRIKEVNETQIIKAKLSSPSGPKMKKKKSSKEQTMTLHTRAATDDIYDLFNQPLPAENAEEDADESSDEDDEDDYTTDGDYTSGAESTGTGRLMSTSEIGDDETSEVKSVSEWSEFSTRKHVPNLDQNKTRERIDDEDEAPTNTTGFSEIDHKRLETIEADNTDMANDFENHVPSSPLGGGRGLETPISPEPKVLSTTYTNYVSSIPMNYDVPTHPYRNPAQVSDSRLPFMTPIAEKTEHTLGLKSLQKPSPIQFFQEDANCIAVTPKEGIANGSGSLITPTKDIFDGLSLVTPTKSGSGKKRARQLTDDQGSGKKLFKYHDDETVKARLDGGVLVEEILQALLSPKTQQKPAVKLANCNPVDSDIREDILSNVFPPLETYNGYHSHLKQGSGISARTKEIKVYTEKVKKAQGRKEKTNTKLHIEMPILLSFSGTPRQYEIKKELGSGAFAPVYLLENVDPEGECDEEMIRSNFFKDRWSYHGRKPLEALKMEDPPTAWEFYIMRQAQARLFDTRAIESITKVYEIHMFHDECFMIEEYRDQGTLLNVINSLRGNKSINGGEMDEKLVIFFAIELFRTIEALHENDLLHGDLKPDNVLLRLDALQGKETLQSKYRSDGTGNWNKKGISLIDFGRGIDKRAFLPDVKFYADWDTTNADCSEMRSNKPWTYQIDYYGLANTIHTMLFGEYLDPVKEQVLDEFGNVQSERYDIGKKLKRYYQAENIWNPCFDLLLNASAKRNTEKEEGEKMPCLRGMRTIREDMEKFLEKKGDGLAASLRELEKSVNAVARKNAC